MKNRITVRNGHQSPKRSRWFANRSQAAGVLLSGWFFFWIVGIVTPCCVAFAGAPDDHAMSQAMPAEVDPGHGGMAQGPVHQNEECPLAFTADAPLPSQVFMLSATSDYTPHLAAVGQVAPLLAAAEFSLPSDLFHPPPPPRIYLRTLRLRI